jgi:hypothetical protein
MSHPRRRWARTWPSERPLGGPPLLGAGRLPSSAPADATFFPPSNQKAATAEWLRLTAADAGPFPGRCRDDRLCAPETARVGEETPAENRPRGSRPADEAGTLERRCLPRPSGAPRETRQPRARAGGTATLRGSGPSRRAGRQPLPVTSESASLLCRSGRLFERAVSRVFEKASKRPRAVDDRARWPPALAGLHRLWLRPEGSGCSGPQGAVSPQARKLVGVPRFELGTSASRTQRSGQAELHPDPPES